MTTWQPDPTISDAELAAFDEDDDEVDCGRWLDGRLTNSCGLMGTEYCDFECALRDLMH